MGFKGLLLDRTEDNSILNQMVLFSLDGCPVYGEDADESADYFSKIYVMGDGLNSLKTGDILIEFSNIKNLAGHNSQSVSVIQVLDPTAFSVYETDDTDDGSHYRALEISSSSAYKMFQTFDMSLSAFLTEKYYYRYYSGGQFVTYDYDTDEISVQGTFEDAQYIVF